MLVRHLKQPVIIKKLTSPKQKSPKKDVAQKAIHLAFSCRIFYGVSWALHRAFSCAMLAQQYSTTLNSSFPVKCCLEPLGQHCTRILPVQCCPKSIKTKLNGNFFLCNVVWSLLDNNTQGFYLCNVVPRVLRQHWTRFFPKTERRISSRNAFWWYWIK